MAQAKVVKSRRGNDLVVLTVGPKEVATIIDALETAGKGAYAYSLVDTLNDVQDKTSNGKYLNTSETVEFQPIGG